MSHRTLMYDDGKCLNLLTTFFFTFCHLSQLFENAPFNPPMIKPIIKKK